VIEAERLAEGQPRSALSTLALDVGFSGADAIGAEVHLQRDHTTMVGRLPENRERAAFERADFGQKAGFSLAPRPGS